MKTILKFMALIAFVALVGISFTACENGDCDHNWVWVETTPPTETLDGVETETCTKCDATKGTRDIPALGNGSTECEEGCDCEVCDPPCETDCDCEKCDPNTGEPICEVCDADPCECGDPDCQHNETEWRTTIDATCLINGTKELRCKDQDCNYRLETDTLTATGHAMSEWTLKTAATCVAARVDSRNCTNQGCTLPEETQNAGEPDPNAHVMSEWTLKTTATCIASRVDSRNCTRQGCLLPEETQNVGTPDTNAHAMSEWTLKTAATCVASRVDSRNCTRQGCTLPEQTQNVGEPLGHDDGEWDITKPATTTEAGTKNLVCTVCGYVIEEGVVIPIVQLMFWWGNYIPETSAFGVYSDAVFNLEELVSNIENARKSTEVEFDFDNFGDDDWNIFEEPIGAATNAIINENGTWKLYDFYGNYLTNEKNPLLLDTGYLIWQEVKSSALANISGLNINWDHMGYLYLIYPSNYGEAHITQAGTAINGVWTRINNIEIDGKMYNLVYVTNVQTVAYRATHAFTFPNPIN